MEDVLGSEEEECNKSTLVWNGVGFAGIGGTVLSVVALASCDLVLADADASGTDEEFEYPAKFGLFKTNAGAYYGAGGPPEDPDYVCGTLSSCRPYDYFVNPLPGECEGRGLSFDDGGPQTAARVCGIVAMVISAVAFIFNLCLFHFRANEKKGTCLIGGCMYASSFVLQLLVLLYRRNDWCRQNACRLGTAAIVSIVSAILFLFCAVVMLFVERPEFKVNPVEDSCTSDKTDGEKTDGNEIP